MLHVERPEIVDERISSVRMRLLKEDLFNGEETLAATACLGAYENRKL